MDKVAERILFVFGEFRVGKDEFLQDGSLSSRKFKWERGVQDQVASALNWLVDEQFIEPKIGLGFTLLEKGYNYLYSPENITPELVGQKILEEFRDFKIGEGEFIQQEALGIRVSRWDRGFADKVKQGLEWLINNDNIAVKEGLGYTLTERGYKDLYG